LTTTELDLSDFEYTFYTAYTAVADNKSTQELMQYDKLRELAVVLTERVRQNASIDWIIKESVLKVESDYQTYALR